MSRIVKFLAMGVVVFGLSLATAFADSQARIVRLSSIEGNVQIDRATGQGFEKAFANLPVTQAVQLKTGSDGRAEVEFEDGSTLRITPSTVVTFPDLSRASNGGTVSTVQIQEGMAYVNFLGAKDSVLNLAFARERVEVTKPAHLRVDVADTDATIAVFKGDVSVSGESGTFDLSKKQTATFNMADKDRYTVANNLEEDPYDAWDKSQSDYQRKYASNSYVSNSPYSYGASDLNYYGNYMNVPGFGMLWQPYFAGAGWSPYMDGTWMYYPGYGYQWVSGYPWGWMPYHYGNWVYVPTWGWGWQPGGSWAGFNNGTLVSNPPSGFVPPRKPSAPGSTPVVVGRGGSFPTPGSGKKVVIPEGSAGFGIPRGSVRNMGKLSQQVSTKGQASTKLNTTPATTSWPSATSPSSTRIATPSAPRTSSPRISTPHAPSGPHGPH
jgi:hypothetical protein